MTFWLWSVCPIFKPNQSIELPPHAASATTPTSRAARGSSTRRARPTRRTRARSRRGCSGWATARGRPSRASARTRSTRFGEYFIILYLYLLYYIYLNIQGRPAALLERGARAEAHLHAAAADTRARRATSYLSDTHIYVSLTRY